MTSVFLFWERPSRSWRGSEVSESRLSLLLVARKPGSSRRPAHKRYGKALEARRTREPKMVGGKPDSARPTSRPSFRACITSKLGRAEACEGGLGVLGSCAEVFPLPLRALQEIRSIGHNSRKLLSLIYPVANRASTWNQVYLAFFVVVRFKCCVQMIRSTLSKFENGINAR
jgi:hypothetical protein